MNTTIKIVGFIEKATYKFVLKCCYTHLSGICAEDVTYLTANSEYLRSMPHTPSIITTTKTMVRQDRLRLLAVVSKIESTDSINNTGFEWLIITQSLDTQKIIVTDNYTNTGQIVYAKHVFKPGTIYVK